MLLPTTGQWVYKMTHGNLDQHFTGNYDDHVLGISQILKDFFFFFFKPFPDMAFGFLIHSLSVSTEINSNVADGSMIYAVATLCKTLFCLGNTRQNNVSVL